MTTTIDNDKEVSKSLSVPVKNSDNWQDIVKSISDSLVDSDLEDDVIKAAELLLTGYPVYKVADKLNTSPQIVRQWISRYPAMANAISNGKKLLVGWRLSQLEKQFYQAIQRSEEILELDLDGIDKDGKKVNPKVLTVVAAQARYIIGLFAGQRQDITVTHEMGETILKAREDALDYLAERLQDQQRNADTEPIEAVVRVIDPRMDDTGPVLDENGNPPFGSLGILEQRNDKLVCAICNGEYRSLAKHLLQKHNVTVTDYEAIYMLEQGEIRKAEENLYNDVA